MIRVIKSKILNESIVLVSAREELEDGYKEAQRLDCALYTEREAEYLASVSDDMQPEEKPRWLRLVNRIKKRFGGFMAVPVNWNRNAEER